MHELKTQFLAAGVGKGRSHPQFYPEGSPVAVGPDMPTVAIVAWDIYITDAPQSSGTSQQEIIKARGQGGLF